MTDGEKVLMLRCLSRIERSKKKKRHLTEFQTNITYPSEKPLKSDHIKVKLFFPFPPPKRKKITKKGSQIEVRFSTGQTWSRSVGQWEYNTESETKS